MSNVFISFSSEDVDFATRLSEAIKERTGFTTWLYTEQLYPGDRWGPAIDQAIEECAALVVVMTPAAAQSQYVTYEWAYADGLDRRIIPIHLKETDLHRKLKDHYQYIDFRSTPRWDELIDRLKELVGTGVRYKISAPRGASDTLRNAAQQLNSANPGERNNAIDTLIQVADDEEQGKIASDILADAINSLPVANTQVDAAFALAGAYNDKRAAPKLREIALNSRHSRCHNAIQGLGALKDVDAIPDLCELLRGRHLDTCQLAARALGEIGSVEAVPCLLETLKSSVSGIKRDAAFALSQIGGEEAVMSLVQVMNDASEESNFRGEIALELGSVKHRDETQHIVQPALINAVSDLHQPPDVRRNATEALGTILLMRLLKRCFVSHRMVRIVLCGKQRVYRWG
jgi:HEAT repeat protein